MKVFLISHGDFFLIRYSDETEFLVNRAGSEVWCRWKQEFPFTYAATYLYGPILGLLLRLRGVVCLHAGVAVIDGWAAGFVGPGGAGKSTLCAALAERGHRVLSDDILALNETGGQFHAVPAYPRVRLWPESAGALFGSPDALRPITEGWDKRHLDLDAASFEPQTKPVGAIYFLQERNNHHVGPRIETFEGAKALSSLLANIYAYKIFDKEMRAHEFKLLSRLANVVPLRSLVPFDDLGRLDDYCRLIRDDFATLPRPEASARV